MSLKLSCLSTDWGQELHTVALQRGINSTLHVAGQRPSAGRTIFTRLPQRSPDSARKWALEHIRQGRASVQSEEDILCYENRGRQAEVLADFYPESIKVLTTEAAEDAIEALGLPIVSKAPWGSGSATVRLLASKDEAMAEAKLILEGKGKTFGGGWPVQHGILLWQAMIPACSYALRVTRITEEWGWLFKVMNRPHDFRASGSGVCVPVTEAELWSSPFYRYAINTALSASRVMGSRWVGFDLLYDKRQERWRIVDTTLAWTLSPRIPGASYDAELVNFHTFGRHPKYEFGRSQWNVLLDDLLEAA